MTIETESKIKIWGNSLGILIPKESAARENLSPDDIVDVMITKKITLKDMFGALKDSKIDAQRMKDQSRKMWKM
jgi:antitoxin component of MazEF toxin-antitoxin module